MSNGQMRLLIKVSQERGYDPRNSLDNLMKVFQALELWKQILPRV